MKIVNRKTFLSIPSGTLFQKYEPSGNLGALEIKVCNPADGWKNDFVTVSLTDGWPKGPTDSGELFEIWDKIESGEEFQMDYESSSRDGLFDEDQLFCVYDNWDINALIRQLQYLV